MQTYSEFSPTSLDHSGAFLPDRQAWLVAPVGITRDSEPGDYLTSNWHVLCAELSENHGPEGGSWEIHRFGHWGPGWFEIVLLRPGSKAADYGQEVEASLEDYPILDEEDHSEREFEAISEAWTQMDMQWRIESLVKAGASIFAARNESPWNLETASGDWPYALIQP